MRHRRVYDVSASLLRLVSLFKILLSYFQAKHSSVSESRIHAPEERDVLTSTFRTQWDGEHQGKCVDVNALAFANAGLCIVLDLVTLGLPISQVVKLQLSLRKKFWVTAMLSVGLM